MKITLTTLTLSAFLLTGCGTLTGIPSHGGGKRFAVEQELVAASSRAAVKEMDLSALKGRKVALYVSTMGDQGSGSITGGRYSIPLTYSAPSAAVPNYTSTTPKPLKPRPSSNISPLTATAENC